MVQLARKEKSHSPSQMESHSTLTSLLMRTVTSPNPPGSPWPPNSLTPFHSSFWTRSRKLESKMPKAPATMPQPTTMSIK
ncbi:UNVERIFIED_CONTAM: hypothetical protein GTU68_033301 [Idotea baltica]|nr:hypothetical protein [Idotea baltica]